MARTRNIKPSTFKNEKLAELPAINRLLFIGLWTQADFKGCLENRPKRLKAEILPYDDIDIIPVLESLAPEFIRFYTEQGRSYIKIVTFIEHQHPHQNEVKAGSEIPEYNEQNDLFHSQGTELNGNNKKPDYFRPEPDNVGLTPPLNLKPQTLNLKPSPSNLKQIFGGGVLNIFEDKFLELEKLYPKLNLIECLKEADECFQKNPNSGPIEKRLAGFLLGREKLLKEKVNKETEDQLAKEYQKIADAEFMRNLETKKAAGDFEAEIRSEFIRKYNQSVYNSWVGPCDFYHQKGDKFLIIGCPNRFVKDWIRGNYHDFFDKLAEKRGLMVDYLLKKQEAA